MEFPCEACATRLSLPDEQLPQGDFSVQCPSCKAKVVVHRGGQGPAVPGGPDPLPGGGDAPAAAPPAPAAPPTAPSDTVTQPSSPPPPAAPSNGPQNKEAAAPPPPAEAPSEPVEPAEEYEHLEDDFVENAKLALACFDTAELQGRARTALEALGYAVHVPAKVGEAVARLRRVPYEVVLLQEDYGGSAEANGVLRAIQPMPMTVRRHLCVGLLGKELKTFDHMTAFARSVNFVVSDRDADKLDAITRQAVADNDKFYRVFREALHEAGKA